MNDLYIENAAAIGPLGQSLDEIWNKLLAGETAYGRVDLPSGRSFFAAETVENSASSIAAYAPLFYEAIRALVDSLKVDVPVDAIFFGTAVGNLAYVENEVYSCRDLPVERLDFSELETIFAQTHPPGVPRPGLFAYQQAVVPACRRQDWPAK